MSWIDNIQDNIKITTGDGKVYEPLYKITEKTVEYNVAEFNFPNIEGTLVKKSEPKGARHKFELVFQGPDHIEESKAFEISNKDRRPWKVFHPIWGNLTVQPTSLSFNPSGLSDTKINAEVIETITEELPRVSIDPKNKISFDYMNTNVSIAAGYSDNVIPTASDVTQLAQTTDTLYSLGAESVKSGDQANEYFQLYNKASAAILNAASDASTAATLVIDLYTYPSLFVSGVKDRLTLLFNQLLSISDDLENLLTFNEKTTYEMSGAGIISAMVNASINPDENDYVSTNEVLDVITQVLTSYNQYVVNIDSLQTPTGDEENSYIPNYDSISDLSDLVNYSVANLFNIALGAKQERFIFLESDSNAIILAHRFYGLEEDDSTIDDLINQNNIGINEMLQIKKGRKIIYYV